MASESSLTNLVDVTVKGRYGVILYLFQTRIYMLFADREVRIGKNCALGHRFSQYGQTLAGK